MDGLWAWLQVNRWILTIIMVWDLSWRLLAMWYAARQSQKVWFVSILLINALGLLPLGYLIFVSKEKFWKNINWGKNKEVKVEEAVVVKKKKK